MQIVTRYSQGRWIIIYKATKMEDDSGERGRYLSQKKKPQKILPCGRRALLLLPGISPRSNSASQCAIQIH
jgi:hypothetical protein